MKARRIQTQRAGGHYKARFEGQADFVFGPTKEDAITRLKEQSEKHSKFRKTKR